MARSQTSLLPRDPVAPNGLYIARVLIPADDVGGDYYDILAQPRTVASSRSGDVSGHGLDAGLVMLMVQSAMSAITTARSNISPSELLTLVNEVLYENIARRLARADYVAPCPPSSVISRPAA